MLFYFPEISIYCMVKIIFYCLYITVYISVIRDSIITLATRIDYMRCILNYCILYVFEEMHNLWWRWLEKDTGFPEKCNKLARLCDLFGGNPRKNEFTAFAHALRGRTATHLCRECWKKVIKITPLDVLCFCAGISLGLMNMMPARTFLL